MLKSRASAKTYRNIFIHTYICTQKKEKKKIKEDAFISVAISNKA